MLWLYRIFFVPAFLLMLPAYARRMRRRGGYGENLAQRFGRQSCPPRAGGSARRVWLQAVSVGEMLAVAPLIADLHRRGIEIFLTTTTSTGYQLARTRYAAQTLAIGYFPLDWWPVSAATWRRVQPDLVILTEGERWPEHLRQAALRSVPVVCINARLSDRSFRRLRRFRPAARLLLGGITRLLPSSPQDEERFRALGFDPERMVVTGNIKLDVAIEPLSAPQIEKWRRDLGIPAGSLVLAGASTWPGEESALVECLIAARSKGLDCALLLVPRHAERRADLRVELSGPGLRIHFRSTGLAAGPCDIAVADTTGELQRLLQLADVVFVGKSLSPHTEGQTPVEAAALGKAIVFGPGMGNFREIAGDLVRAAAARRVESTAELTATVTELLGQPASRRRLGAAAETWHRRNRGAVERTLAVIYSELGQ
jgi:3-deoxy-D-manno-octulosonic-acid transferase